MRTLVASSLFLLFFTSIASAKGPEIKGFLVEEKLSAIVLKAILSKETDELIEKLEGASKDKVTPLFSGQLKSPEHETQMTSWWGTGGRRPGPNNRRVNLEPGAWSEWSCREGWIPLRDLYFQFPNGEGQFAVAQLELTSALTKSWSLAAAFSVNGGIVFVFEKWEHAKRANPNANYLVTLNPEKPIRWSKSTGVKQDEFIASAPGRAGMVRIPNNEEFPDTDLSNVLSVDLMLKEKEKPAIYKPQPLRISAQQLVEKPAVIKLDFKASRVEKQNSRKFVSVKVHKQVFLDLKDLKTQNLLEAKASVSETNFTGTSARSGRTKNGEEIPIYVYNLKSGD